MEFVAAGVTYSISWSTFYGILSLCTHVILLAHDLKFEIKEARQVCISTKSLLQYLRKASVNQEYVHDEQSKDKWNWSNAKDYKTCHAVKCSKNLVGAARLYRGRNCRRCGYLFCKSCSDRISLYTNLILCRACSDKEHEKEAETNTEERCIMEIEDLLKDVWHRLTKCKGKRKFLKSLLKSQKEHIRRNVEQIKLHVNYLQVRWVHEIKKTVEVIQEAALDNQAVLASVRSNVVDVKAHTVCAQRTIADVQIKVDDVHSIVEEANKGVVMASTSIETLGRRIEELFDQQKYEPFRKLKLDPLNASKRKLSGFDPVSREWVKKRIQNWWTADHWTRAFVLKGAAGMGKSVISSQLFQGTLLSKDPQLIVGAAHFFDFSNKDTSDFTQVMWSIAKQLTKHIPELDKILERDVAPKIQQGLRDRPLEEQFFEILANPCKSVKPPSPDNVRLIIILDALDECDSQVRTDLLGILQNEFVTKMPSWMGFFLSTRNEEYVNVSLCGFKPTELDSEQEKNEEDMKDWFKHRLKNVGLTDNELDQAVFLLTKRSKGLFLYARFVNDTLTRLQSMNNIVSLQDIEDENNFASGMNGTYKNYFSRFRDDALRGEYTMYRDLFAPMVSSRDNLPVQFFEPLLRNKVRKDDENLEEEEIEDAIEELLDKISNLVSITTNEHGDTVFRFVHKSMADWLTDKKNNRDKKLRVPRRYPMMSETLLERIPRHLFTYTHVVYHLLCEEKYEQAANLLLSPEWLLNALQASKQSSGVLSQQLIKDVECHWVEQVPPSHVKQVLRVLKLGSIALYHDPQELASQCLGRLPVDHPALHHVEQLYRNKMIRWLKPTYRSLTAADSQLIKILRNHSSSVLAVAISKDCKTMVSGSWDNTVRVWNLQSGLYEVETLEGHSERVTSVAINGSTVISGSADNLIKCWDIQSGVCKRTLQGHSSVVNSVAIGISKNGVIAVSGSNDLSVRSWDLQSGTCKQILQGHSERITSVAVNNITAVSGSADTLIKCWDLQSGTCKQTLQGHSSVVSSVDISKDGLMAISGSNDCTVRVWDLQNGDCKRMLQGHSSIVTSVKFSQDGLVAISGSGSMLSKEKAIRVWDLESGICKQTLHGHSSWVTSVAISEGTLVSSSSDTTIRIWDLQSRDTKRETLQGHSNFVTCLAVSQDGLVAISGSADNCIKIWDVPSGACKKTLQNNFLLQPHQAEYVSALALSKDGYKLVSGSWDKLVRVWNLQSGKYEVEILEGHCQRVTSVAVNNRTVVSASADNLIKCWDLQSGTCKQTIQGHSSVIYSLTISEDECTVLSRSDSETFYWNIETGKQCSDIPIASDVNYWDIRTTTIYAESPNRDDGFTIHGRHVKLDADTVGFTVDGDIRCACKVGSCIVLGMKSGMVHLLLKC